MQSVKDIFHYLERTVLIREVNEEQSSFWQIALSQVRSEMRAEVMHHLKNGVLELIKNERAGQVVDRGIIAKSIHVLLALNLYKEFEKMFLDQT